jgi:hypothetical protein
MNIIFLIRLSLDEFIIFLWGWYWYLIRLALVKYITFGNIIIS